MPNSVKALLACTRHVRPQIYAPQPQNDNDNPGSPASALALHPRRRRAEATAIGPLGRQLQQYRA